MGSYNFTASAEKTNDENLVVIHDPKIAAEYIQEFLRVYRLSKP
jgi:phosphatidylserine/phosphatidylglycerophosphate/cardiolipin synthase-like enzyme